MTNRKSKRKFIALVAIFGVLAFLAFSGLFEWAYPPYAVYIGGATYADCPMVSEDTCQVYGQSVAARQYNPVRIAAKRSNKAGIWHDPPEDADTCTITGTGEVFREEGKRQLTGTGKASVSGVYTLCTADVEDFGLSPTARIEIENPTVTFQKGTPQPPADLCDGVVCDPSITICPDGAVATCPSNCDPETGLCVSCLPDCTGHGLPEPPTPECYAKEDCACIVLLGYTCECVDGNCVSELITPSPEEPITPPPVIEPEDGQPDWTLWILAILIVLILGATWYMYKR